MALSRRYALLAKAEATYAVDSLPTGAADAMLVSGLQVSPLEGGQVTRDNVTPHLGAKPTVAVNSHVKMAFDVEAAGAGAAGTVPAYGALLRACGLAETVAVGVDVTYTPVSEAFESVVLYANKDGTRHKTVGSRGTFKLTAKASEYPKYSFDMTGLYAAPTAVALPTPDFTAFQTPLVVGDATTTFDLGGFAGILSSFELDLGQAVAGRFLVGQEEVRISDREATGSIVIDAPALVDFDAFAAAFARQTKALTVTQGTVAGNIVVISVPLAEIGSPSYSEADGVDQITVPFRALPSDGGNDEISIVVK